MKRILAIALVSILCLSCFSSCGLVNSFIELYENFYSHGMDSVAMVEQFTVDILAEDYDKALNYLHPDSIITKESLEKAVSSVKEKQGVDFSQEYTFEDLEFGVSPIVKADSNGEMDILKVEYSVSFSIFIGEAEVQLSCVVLQDDNGFGILMYNLK